MADVTYNDIYIANPVTSVGDSDILTGWPTGGPAYGITQ